MPIRNEGDFIARSLGSVLAQDYPKECLEILVVDGRSEDNTRTIVENIIQAHPSHKIYLIDNPRYIVPTGLNIGIQQARGDIIIRVDGHCEIPSDYVSRCVKLLEETRADNVGGLQYAEGQNLMSRAIAFATSSPFGVGGAKFHYASQPAWVDTVYLGAYRREVFSRIGGFDEELVRNQDDEFNFRLVQAGGKIWLDPAIKVKYYSRSNFYKLWRQYFQYGLYKVRVIQKRRALPSWRHVVPAGFVVGLLFTNFLALATGNALWSLASSGPYALANVMASIWTARKNWRTLPLLPLAYLILHLSYGTGFLWGLWRWRHNWRKQ